jgi:transposase-like protein
MKKLDEETIKEIIRLRKEGYKIRHIVARLKINKNTVVKYSKRIFVND